jgi:hypothetical protein
VHQLVNKGFESIKMHGTTVKKKKALVIFCFNVFPILFRKPYRYSVRFLSPGFSFLYFTVNFLQSLFSPALQLLVQRIRFAC